MINVREGRAEDIDVCVAMDASIASDRVLMIDVEDASPEHTIRLRWERTKPEGTRRNLHSDREELEREISQAEGFWVAEIEDRLTRFVVLNRWSWHPTTGDIYSIDVDLPYRGRGVGTALVQVMKDHARS